MKWRGVINQAAIEIKAQKQRGVGGEAAKLSQRRNLRNGSWRIVMAGTRNGISK